MWDLTQLTPVSRPARSLSCSARMILFSMPDLGGSPRASPFAEWTAVMLSVSSRSMSLSLFASRLRASPNLSASATLARVPRYSARSVTASKGRRELVFEAEAW